MMTVKLTLSCEIIYIHNIKHFLSADAVYTLVHSVQLDRFKGLREF